MKSHSKKLDAPDMCDEDITHFRLTLLKAVSDIDKHYEILEWGSGNSTSYFSNYLYTLRRDFHWQSVENQQEWKDKALSLCLSDKVDIELFEYPLPEGEDRRYYRRGLANMVDYIKYPSTLGKKFDVIFVDGYHRNECMEEALKLLEEDGLLIVHDAQRESYQKTFEKFDGEFKGDKLWVGKKK